MKAHYRGLEEKPYDSGGIGEFGLICIGPGEGPMIAEAREVFKGREETHRIEVS